ncbi:cupin domain-containing protein [Sphingomonas ginsenosidivorax]|nr:cupin domain-containing protein [Sphingomonas ginsenosidivorax]
MTKLLVALAILSVNAPVGAQTYPPLQRQSVLEAKLPAANPTVRLVRGAHIRFAPGQPTGLHLHPASTVGVVTEGSFVFQPEGERRRILHVGDSFFEPARHRILHFDNVSRTRSAAITLFYLTDTASRPLIDLLPGK